MGSYYIHGRLRSVTQHLIRRERLKLQTPFYDVSAEHRQQQQQQQQQQQKQKRYHRRNDSVKSCIGVRPTSVSIPDDCSYFLFFFYYRFF